MIQLLDHGHVRLVDHMGSDLSVVRAARVSYNAEPRGDGSDMKLIHYLWKNRHVTPFESVNFVFDLKAPIFTFRQFFRHRTIDDPTQLEGFNGLAYQKYWSYNEVSARYTELPDEFYVPAPMYIGKQSKSSKQARDIVEAHSGDELKWAEEQCELIRDTCEEAFKAYKALLLRGVPRELARLVLPVNTYSQMFATVNLNNLFHFLELRLHPHAQYEIRVYAEAMLELIRPIVPECVRAFEVNLINPPKG